MATFCDDDDIVAEWPAAVADLNGGVASFEATRELVKAEILDTLERRDDPIYEADIQDTTKLLRCEVCGVLSKLFLRAQSTAGDFYQIQFKFYREEYSEELARPLEINGEVRRRGRRIRMVRC
jgi:hypothetical protein